MNKNNIPLTKLTINGKMFQSRQYWNKEEGCYEIELIDPDKTEDAEFEVVQPKQLENSK